MKLFESCFFVCVLAFMFILSGCATLPPLMNAVDKGDVDTVNALLDKGADVNQWHYGTALMVAAGKGDAEMVKLLIERGADVDAMSKGGWTALGLAAESGHADIVEILIARGADVDRALKGLETRAAKVAQYPDIVAKVKRGTDLVIYKAGWVYSSLGRYREAVRSLERAVGVAQSAGARSELFAQLSYCYNNLQQYDDAAASARRAIELKPDYATAYNNLGWAYAKNKDYGEAFEAFRKAMELNPQNAAYYDNLGYFLIEKGDYKEASGYLEKAVDLAPDNTIYLLRLTTAYYLTGRYEDARDTIEKALSAMTIVGIGAGIQVVEGRPAVSSVLASGPAERAGMREGDRIIAIDGRSTEGWKLEEVVSSLRGEEGTKVLLTISRGEEGKPFEISVTREEVIFKDAAGAFARRSLILRQQGRRAEAVKDAEQACSLDSSDELARLALGAARLDGGRYDEAVEVLARIEDDPHARILEATAYARKGDFQRSVDVYASIPDERLSPKKVPLWRDRDALLGELRSFVASKRQEAARLKAQGRYEEALEELGEGMKAAGERELEALCGEIGGILAMKPGLSAVPEEARRYALRGDVLMEEGDFEAAVREYRRATEAAPYIARLHFTTAMLYGELKRYPQAIRYMKTYLLLAPEAPNTRVARDQIYKWEFMMEKEG